MNRDVDGDGLVSALDALRVINRLIQPDRGSLTAIDYWLDVNGDDQVSAFNGLIEITSLSRSSNTQTESDDLIEEAVRVADQPSRRLEAIDGAFASKLTDDDSWAILSPITLNRPVSSTLPIEIVAEQDVASMQLSQCDVDQVRARRFELPLS